MRQSFPRHIDSLAKVFALIESFASKHALDPDLLFNLHLAVEEAFVNTVRHNDAATCDVMVGIELERDLLTITVVDPDTEPFDLTKAGPVDTTRPIQERKPGGLGVFLIKRLMDEVTFEHKDRVSTIRMMKKLESKNV